ncbi:hypothetical protein BDU57DRAFT_523067 [Ampelomyces quisqualis]|uniref:Uncharacterized protein n=1 Tax=Ampelomyces quisqualis TaxID=50730 RepID=A0A6A5QB90_AMPQU|nr:hypothetical protein BDU57DRAFT_523067 [Ampelomyces quisqualis]
MYIRSVVHCKRRLSSAARLISVFARVHTRAFILQDICLSLTVYYLVIPLSCFFDRLLAW